MDILKKDLSKYIHIPVGGELLGQLADISVETAIRILEDELCSGDDPVWAKEYGEGEKTVSDLLRDRIGHRSSPQPYFKARDISLEFWGCKPGCLKGQRINGTLLDMVIDRIMYFATAGREPELEPQYIIIEGDPGGQLTIHGPFHDPESATQWAKKNLCSWSLTLLNPPK